MKTKRFLSVALTLVMLISLFPGMGLTASAAGSTTEITPSNTSGTLTITLKIKADQAAPAAPTAASVTINSITLNTITNGEYKMGDGEWQDSPAFTGLTMNTEYTFYQRLKGDEDHNASPASPAAVIKTSNHVHSFTYSASGNTITATCTAGCTLPEGKISFSVLVPSGVTYDGNPHFASIEGGEAFSAATGIPVSADDIVYRYMVTDSVVSEPVDAGSYQVLYTLQSDFPRPVVGLGMTIAKAAGSVSYAEAGVSKTFGEDAFTNPLTNTGDGSVSYASDATGVATVDASTGEVTIVGAGSTTITATVEDSTNYTYATKTASYTLTVSAVSMTVSASGYTGAYDGNSHGITVSVTAPTSGYTVKYGTTEGTYDLDASPAITNAADSPLTVYYQVTANGYNPATGSATVAISKADITPTASLEGWTYGETAKTPSVSGNTDNGDVTYTYAAKGSTDFSATVPTNAGDYTVKATVAETDNYNGGEATADFTIAKAAITITADDKSSKYGDDLVALTYTVGGAYKTGDDLGVTVSTTATKTSDVGEYPITVSWIENANYTATLVNGKYTITKTGLTVTATGYSGTYDGAAHGISVDVGSSGATVYYAATELTAENYTTVGSTTAPTYTDAGEYTVYFYVVSGNYDPDTISGSKTIEITKADGAAAEPAEIQSWTQEDAVVTAADGQEYVIVPKGGTPDWSKAVEGNADGIVAFENLTAATEYDIYTRVTADANHDPGEAVKTELLTSLYGLEMMDELYVGETITVKPDPADAEGLSYQWYYAEGDDEAVTRGAIIEGANSASYTLKPADYGKTLWVEITKNGKELENTTYGPVEKREIEPAVTIEGWAENEAVKAPSVTGNTGNGAVTYTYAVKGSTDFSATVPTTAGDYTVKATVAETDAYYGGEATADFTIQAVYTVKFSTDGGTEIKEQTVLAGNKAAKPADPEKDGNEFSGWYQDATFSVAFDFDTPITADTTLYAMWTPNDYTLQSITGTTTDVSHSWTKGSGKDVVITVKLTTEPDNSFAHFTGVQIDGKTLTRDTDYTAREGSTIVTLKPATLQKLSVGVHTVTINFDNGSVETKLTIKAAPGSSTSPKTGDTSLTGLWAALMAVSGIGLGGMLLVDHKCRKARTR